MIFSTNEQGGDRKVYCGWSCALLSAASSGEGRLVSVEEETKPTTKPHPPNFHKDQESADRCWACSGSGLLDITEDDWDFARKLKDDGYHQTSNKYRIFSQCPKVPSFDELCPPRADCPDWLRKRLQQAYDNETGESGARSHGINEITATPGQFRAFKKLCDPSWKPPPPRPGPRAEDTARLLEQTEAWLRSKGWTKEGPNCWTAPKSIQDARAHRGAGRYVKTDLSHAVNTQRLVDGGIPRAQQNEILAKEERERFLREQTESGDW
jgi:hypothetical protein